MAQYRGVIDTLTDAGLVYRSFESRSDIARRVAQRETVGPWPRDPDGVPRFPGGRLAPDRESVLMADGAPYAWRLAIDVACERAGSLTWLESGEDPDIAKGQVDANPSAWGDAVLARKETPTSYHLAVVTDDALQGITDVIRGSDLYHATSLHRLLQALLGLPEPHYHHHALVRDDAGLKLAKATRATSLRDLRANGVTPRDIRRRLGLGPV